MSEDTTETPGTRIAVCGSTRCQFNEDLRCTAKTVKIGIGGDCKTEKWLDDHRKAVAA